MISGIGFGLEFVQAFGDELIFQLDVILNNSVVHHHNFARAITMRVCVFFRGPAMRGPACMPDAVQTFQWCDAN